MKRHERVGLALLLILTLLVAYIAALVASLDRGPADAAMVARDRAVRACLARAGGIPSRQAECWSGNPR
jgi:hypothetical protein